MVQGQPHQFCSRSPLTRYTRTSTFFDGAIMQMTEVSEGGVAIPRPWITLHDVKHVVWLSIASAVLPPVALGVGPAHQTGTPRPEIVQMRTSSAEVGVTATGSIISAFIDSTSTAWLCVLTADHVAAAGATGIAFGNGNPVDRILMADESLIFRSDAGADVSVLGVRYGVPDDFFRSLQPLSLAPLVPESLLGRSFTQVAFGETGELTDAGMARVARAGVQGVQNNRFERVRSITPSAFNPYSYAALEWDFDQPGSANAIAGEGSSFAGDSGSPYLTSLPSLLTLASGESMWTYTDSIAAVHTYGDGSSVHGWVGSGDHVPGGGVAITPELSHWITAQCGLVPSPGCSILLTMAVAARRRR